MIVKDIIEKYIGLETLKGIDKVHNLYSGDEGEEDIDIKTFLDRETDEEEDVFFWKCGSEKRLRIQFNKDGYIEGYLEWEYNVWNWEPGYS